MFHDPLFLLALLIIPLLIWRSLSGGQHAAVSFSSALSSIQVGRSWRQRIAWLPAACTLLALALMMVAMARPRAGRDKTIINSEGIAIEMVVDRSSSMQAMDFMIDGERVDRLTAVKNVAGQFVLGEQADPSSTLSGRESDLVGLIMFAGYADALTPPTLDHRFLTAQLNRTSIVSRRSEDGTAIGDAVSLAVEKLDSLDQQTKTKVRSKVIILLTDGENTAGEMSPARAAEIAATMGIKVYTIGVGTRGVAPVPEVDAFGRVVLRNRRVNIDETTLMKIAEATGGKYFRATDTDSLQSIYREIDQLEKSEVESTSFVDYRELAVQPVQLGGLKLPPLLLAALALLLLRVLVQHTMLRQFP
ncbi:MAG: VWA domain-containing protein [Pirellulales bacterium]|nr:VWA domain-containing protein [Pirellulales bacterium]